MYSSKDIGLQPSHESTQQQTSGLARYMSAPNSFLAALLDSETNSNNNNNNNNNSSNGSGDESEAIFSAFMNGTPDLNQQFGLKQEIGVGSVTRPGEGNGYGQMGFEGVVNVGGGTVVGSYSVDDEVRVRNGNRSSLLRQTSSPAGFLNGYSVMEEVGNYKVQNHLETASTVTGLNNRVNFSSGPSSSLRFMPSIPESATESIVGRESSNNVRNGNARELEGSVSWNESAFNNLKRNREGDLKMFSTFGGLDNQNAETGKNASSGLIHHLSMPKTSSEMAAVEKYLQFQPDTTVPCQVRAKRGFATHPRSIAERIRRTKISDKMKKLQDLFPSIDKLNPTKISPSLHPSVVSGPEPAAILTKPANMGCAPPAGGVHPGQPGRLLRRELSGRFNLSVSVYLSGGLDNCLDVVFASNLNMPNIVACEEYL